MADSRRFTDPLRARHRELVGQIEELRLAAAGAGDLDRAAVQRRITRAISFLSEGLLPHARVEEETLYPVVERTLGSPGCTTTMRRDHVEIARMTEALRFLEARLRNNPTRDTIEALRRLLYGLHAVVMLHLAKEEELYLPILDRELDASDAEQLVEAMHEPAGA